MPVLIDIRVTICYNYSVPLSAGHINKETTENKRRLRPLRQRIKIMNKNKDLYKRFVTFISGILLLGMITGIFAFIWYRNYSEQIILPYYRRGNWVLIAIYCLLVWLFFRAYGGFKLGYLKKTDMLYSQMISLVPLLVSSRG